MLMLANFHSLKKGVAREIVEMSPEILLVNAYHYNFVATLKY